MGIIYRATNVINGKFYIGQTTKSLNKRISKHYEDSVRHSYKFANALRKYKSEDWKWEIIVENVSKQHLNELEIFLIWFHDSYKNGYNSTVGGDDNPTNDPKIRKKISLSQSGEKNHMFGKHLSEEHRKKISLTSTGRRHSDDSKKKISLANSGENHPMFGRTGENNPLFGRKHNKESRNKISDSKSKIIWKIIKPNGEIEIVKNLRRYCRDNNLNHGDMYAVARGRYKQYMRYKVEKQKCSSETK